MKEIGIRKVLGATISQILGLFSKEFAYLVLIAIVFTIPIGIIVSSSWLDNFAYRISIGMEIFLFAGFIALTVAITTISMQSIKAARRNPVDSLRSE